MTIRPELSDELLKDCSVPREVLAEGTQGEIEIAVPRDRQTRFEPQLIQKHQTRFEGKILALYARGMTRP